jgi:membrane-bound lytic murein transglycosylase D
MAVGALPLLWLGGCATQPRHASASPDQTLVIPPASGGTADAQSGAPASSAAGVAAPTGPAGSTAATTAADGLSAAGGDTAGTGAPDADAAGGGAGGPPADSLVTARPADLLVRIRSGFMLPEVDEPAIDSQVNWFANHPDFLDRTWTRAQPWLYYIIGQLEQRNMPRELALLPVIESAFEPYAYSRASASGIWQFVSDTGRRFGLKQDWWYDGRRDPIAATGAALDYLQALHDEFNGDWLLAIAAYNCGELMVERAIQRNERLHRPTDFWHLRLPAETRSYVPELLAMRRLVADPAKYGLEFNPTIPDEPYFVEVDTGGQISLKVVADIAGISVDDLYELNPGFHRAWTDPTGPFRLLVPADAAEGLQQTLAQLTPDERMRLGHYAVQRRDTLARIARDYKTTPEILRELNGLDARAVPLVDSDLRVPSPDIQLPEKVERAALLVDNGSRFHRGRYRTRVHIVRRGDTLYSIAQRMGTNVRTLAALNGMSPGDSLHTGQRLRLSSGARLARASVHVRRRVRSSRPAHRAGLVATADAATAASFSSSAAGSHRLSYTVRRGDTLYHIAHLLQVTVNDLLTWNGMDDGRSLHPGQVLVAFVKSRS